MASAKVTKVSAKKAAKPALHEKTLEELQADLVVAQSEQLASKQSHRQGELVNVRVLTAQRKTIARLLTAIQVARRQETSEEK